MSYNTPRTVEWSLDNLADAAWRIVGALERIANIIDPPCGKTYTGGVCVDADRFGGFHRCMRPSDHPHATRHNCRCGQQWFAEDDHA